MRKILAAVAVVFLAAGVAQAQQGRGVTFPTLDELKTKVGFDEAQLEKAKPIVEEYTAELKKLSDAAKDAADKKAAFTEIRTKRTEGMGKLLAICTEEQKAKFNEAFPERKKKNT